MTAATLSALLSGVVLGAFLLALLLAWPTWRSDYRVWRDARRARREREEWDRA